MSGYCGEAPVRKDRLFYGQPSGGALRRVIPGRYCSKVTTDVRKQPVHWQVRCWGNQVRAGGEKAAATRYCWGKKRFKAIIPTLRSVAERSNQVALREGYHLPILKGSVPGKNEAIRRLCRKNAPPLYSWEVCVPGRNEAIRRLCGLWRTYLCIPGGRCSLQEGAPETRRIP